jgi:glutamate dehydrogenase
MQTIQQEPDVVTEHFFQQLISIINERLPQKKAALLEKFARYYYRVVAKEDILSHDIQDLYGALLAHWHFLSEISSDISHVRIYNPIYEQDGWESRHTVIEIIHPDMPFIVDSIARALTQIDVISHWMITPGAIGLERDGNEITALHLGTEPHCEGIEYQALLAIEIDKTTDLERLKFIEEYIQQILKDVRLVVQDWPQMKMQASDLLSNLDQAPSTIDPDILKEVKDFVAWCENDHFTFLGCCDFLGSKSGSQMLLDPKSRYGFLSLESRFKPADCFAGFPESGESLTTKEHLVVTNKSNLQSTVHRSVDLDYIAVTLFSKQGQIIGERRFLGLYTAVSYNSSTRNIPWLRRKIQNVFTRSNLATSSHIGKELLNILENLPRDDLFQANEDEIYVIAMGILGMQERKQIKIFLRKDIYKRFFSVLLYLPRELYNSKRRTKIGEILLEKLGGEKITFNSFFSESILARIHFVVTLDSVDSSDAIEPDVFSIQQAVIESCKTWQDELHEFLVEQQGESKAAILFQKYAEAFPPGYMDFYSAKKAVFDMLHIEEIFSGKSISMNLYKPLEETNGHVRFKLFHKDSPLSLSNVLPMLENMGLKIHSENANCITIPKNGSCWISDFVMEHNEKLEIQTDLVREQFQDAFLKTWEGFCENDRFNQLIIDAFFSWREVVVLRAYAKYFRQIRFNFSESYIQATILNHHRIAKMLIDLFNIRFSIEEIDEALRKEKQKEKEKEIRSFLDGISNLDEDRILRKFLDIILATIRTNFFQKDQEGQYKPYLSLKFNPKLIPDLMLPLPIYEIFVYSPRIEGVHLRGGKVARGGIRWSDRREDFRTEVLGLMKAQQVKNAVIVPAGAKGGFVCKHLSGEINRDLLMKEVIACYSMFMRGLLDLTDNLQGGELIPPSDVICYDDPDPYLVVAADKGTATFSDIANAISQEYNFWLKDAFASGGSVGYDHKKMAITARGAWESIKRHFNELGKDIQTIPFTTVGIGDMSGDVFGNGMLLSRKTQLVAAFNHMHIFLDPNPDPEASFLERERLFKLPRSTWGDYASNIISKGGGVFLRTLKSIPLSPEVKARLGVIEDSMIPTDLIKAILKAPVELLWNGGIGTYVKASEETHLQVSDRSNDLLRVNGCELRCKVIGEGGNLGFTQLGRVEAAMAGCLLMTDFIDNSGGVDCSDHEVNIKILLNSIIESGDLTLKQRNELLEKMTDEVAQLVLQNNYKQGHVISLAASRSEKIFDEYLRFMEELEKNGEINRALEFLPNAEKIQERKANKQGFTRSELALLVAYSKITLKKELLNSSLPEDDDFVFALKSEFPDILIEKYLPQIETHHLRREIIATQLSNDIVNSMGVTYVRRLFDETGAKTEDIVRAHIIAREIYEMPLILKQLSALDSKVDAALQTKLLFDFVRLVRRTTRWILRNHRGGLEVNKMIDYYKPLAHELWLDLPDLLSGQEKKELSLDKERLLGQGFPAHLAHRMAYVSPLYAVMDIIAVFNQQSAETLSTVAALYYGLGEYLELPEFRNQISANPVGDNWDALARAGCRDDVDFYQREICSGILKYAVLESDVDKSITEWAGRHESWLLRWRSMLADLRSAKSKEFTIFSVALRELLGVAQASLEQ